MCEACGCRIKWAKARLERRKKPVFLYIAVEHTVDSPFKYFGQHGKY